MTQSMNLKNSIEYALFLLLKTFAERLGLLKNNSYN
jgi:hypothetical protein